VLSGRRPGTSYFVTGDGERTDTHALTISRLYAMTTRSGDRGLKALHKVVKDPVGPTARRGWSTAAAGCSDEQLTSGGSIEFQTLSKGAPLSAAHEHEHDPHALRNSINVFSSPGATLHEHLSGDGWWALLGLVDPALRARPVGELGRGPPEVDLMLSALRRVRAVTNVTTHMHRKVTTDGTRRRVSWVYQRTP